MKYLLILLPFALGCGAVESFETSVLTGKKVEQTETDDLICATIVYGEHVSIDCVRKD